MEPKKLATEKVGPQSG